MSDKASDNEASSVIPQDAAANAGGPQDPKNVQELTNYIQNMLQQMQDRFQSMSDQVIKLKSIFCPKKTAISLTLKMATRKQ